MRFKAASVLQNRHLLELAVFLLALPFYYAAPAVQADWLTTRSLLLSTALPSNSVSYQLSFTINNPSSIGSLKVELCDNSPLQEDPCNPPGGLDASSATLSAQSGLNDFHLLATTANMLVLSRPASGINPPQPVSLTFSGIINPSVAGSYYAKVSTYASADASGSPVDFSGLAFAIISPVQITAKVPPYITFCSAVIISSTNCSQTDGDYLNFGDVSPARASAATSQLNAATNAGNGYVIQVNGTTMTSGNNTINPLTTADTSQPGSSQFGLNLRANSQPAVGADPTGPGSGQPLAPYNTANLFRFQANDSIVLDPHADDFSKYTVSYLINVSPAQPIGTYASTLTYVCTPNF